MLLDGVSAGDVFGYKDEQGNLRSKQGLMTIAEDKTAKSAMLVAAITSTPTGYVFDNTKVTAGDQHITGTVIPVSVTVHLSAVPGELTANALLSGEIGHTQADDTGIWECDIHLDADSIIYASGDTLITLADRTERRLDELTGTELALGGDMCPARILRLARGLWSPQHTLYHFDDETVIDETHEHRFFNVEQGFWQKLKNWRVGDHAKRLDGGAPALVSVEPKEERAEMFGIWVERGSYWANGLLSGDASANRPLLADATVEQAIDMAESLAEKDLMRILGGGVPL